jgi:signal transduction histidine kinase
MLERLRASFERERRFVADASHELRTPVAVIKTELEGALRARRPDPGLAAAADECDRLAQLAEDLLVVARSGEGELPLRRESVDADWLLERVRDRFADRAARAGRAIRVEASAGLRVDGDALRLQQALGNLVDNALRHGAGEIVLRAAPGELSVSDAGPGFDPGFAEHAFERFARGDGARTRGGSGLGLAIVRAIAEAHGGSAAIVPGPGATVRISLRGISAPGPTVASQSTTEVKP